MIRKDRIDEKIEEDDNNEISKSRQGKRQRNRSRDRSPSSEAPKRRYDVEFRGEHNIVLQKNDKFIKAKTLCETCDKRTSTIKRLDPNEITWFWCAVTTVTSCCLAPFFI